MIPNVRPGDYELYGWVPGVFGDYKREGVITIQSGSSIDLDELLIFEAPRDGKTVWEIEVLLSSSSQIQIPNMLTGCFLITRKVIGLKTGSLPMLEGSSVVSGQGERRWLFRAYNMLLRWKVLVTHGGIDMGDALHTKRV